MIALDVWMRVHDDETLGEFDALPDGAYPAEANTYRDGEGYRVDWYLTAVGVVSSRTFGTYDDARQWLTAEGFQDFTS